MGEMDELRRKIQEMREGLLKETVAAIVAEAEEIKAESMANCPVAPNGGVLKASHEVLDPVTDGENWTVTIQVGGAAEPYAMAVHEHLEGKTDLPSPYSWRTAEAEGRPVQWNVGGPKFLENAVRNAIPTFGEKVAARVKAAMG